MRIIGDKFSSKGYSSDIHMTTPASGRGESAVVAGLEVDTLEDPVVNYENNVEIESVNSPVSTGELIDG